MVKSICECVPVIDTYFANTREDNLFELWLLVGADLFKEVAR